MGRCKGRIGVCCGTPTWNIYQEDGCTPTAVVSSWVLVSSRGHMGSVVYLSWSAEVSCRTWSHTCGSWYLPKFLFKEGSFAQINMASLMFLAVTCYSLWIMLKQSGLTRCPVELVCWWMGDWALRCSLSLSPNALLVSQIYSSGQLICGHLYMYMTPLFCSLVSLS